MAASTTPAGVAARRLGARRTGPASTRTGDPLALSRRTAGRLRAEAARRRGDERFSTIEQAVDLRWAEFDSAREEFWSSAHHELRTPLTSIVGYTELLLDGGVGELSPAQLSMLRRVESNGDALLALLEQLLCRTAQLGRQESAG